VVGQSGRLSLKIWEYNKRIWNFGKETPHKIVISKKKREMEKGYKLQQVI